MVTGSVAFITSAQDEALIWTRPSIFAEGNVSSVLVDHAQ
jgi:hypothetical protein